MCYTYTHIHTQTHIIHIHAYVSFNNFIFILNCIKVIKKKNNIIYYDIYYDKITK